MRVGIKTLTVLQSLGHAVVLFLMVDLNSHITEGELKDIEIPYRVLDSNISLVEQCVKRCYAEHPSLNTLCKAVLDFISEVTYLDNASTNINNTLTTSPQC